MSDGTVIQAPMVGVAYTVRLYYEVWPSHDSIEGCISSGRVKHRATCFTYS